MQTFLLIFCVLCIALVAEWMREIHTFKITHYTVCSEKLKDTPKKSIVFLSDLHSCQYGKNNIKLLNAIRKQNPDMILIAGDMVIGGKQGIDTTVAEHLVTELTKICPVYYANGNHEQRMKEYRITYEELYDEYKDALTSQGVQYLENESQELQWGQQAVVIYGLEIPYENYKKFQQSALSIEYLTEHIGEADRQKYNILIAHHPMYVPVYLEWGADLVVSGHLHGGVVRIPHFRGMITPQGVVFPKYSGEMRKEGNQTVIVSKGIGIHTFKVRLFNPTEVVVIHIGNSEG